MSADSGRTVPINGMEMYYEVSGAGEPLVWLHGFTGIGAHWRLIFQQPPEGFRLISPDLRGHGRSTNPSRQFTFRQSALDVFALLDLLQIERFKAIGMSAGAKTLLHMATQQPARVEAMVLVSPAHYFPPQARAAMSRITVESRTEQDWKMLREWHQHGDDQIRMLLEQGNAMKDSYDDMSFTPQQLAAISALTLIVHGDRDPIYPLNPPVEIYEAIPRSYLWIVPNGGHGPIFGDARERFAETAQAFLRGAWES